MIERLCDWVTQQAERRPHAVALVQGAQRLTYGELEALSNRIAALLRDAGCRKGDRVCLFIPKSPIAIASIVGTLKAEGIYVPVDTASPAARARRILDVCECRVALAAGAGGKLLAEALREEGSGTAPEIGWLDDAPEPEGLTLRFRAADLAAFEPRPPDCRTRREDPAHILFTSGSTGVPKGVVITHANVIAFIEWAVRYFGTAPDDRISGHPPLHFDLSTFDIYGTFAAGAQLHLVTPEVSLLPNKLAEFIRRSELTQWFSVPSILNYMAKFDVVRPGDFPSLKRLLWCGEVFPTPALIYWMRRLPHVRFTNLYGPTEATIASSYYTVPACPEDEKAAIPIGTPCDGEELLVLDEDLRRLPPGEVGDLYIGGVGLSPGYWRDPRKTAEVFLPHPFRAEPGARIYKTGDLARLGEDGLVYFLGRADSQIKSRGYRIELGEIETALNSLGLLKEVAVVAVDTEGFEGKTICCAYAPAAEVTVPRLKEELGRLVPAYMLPARWLELEVLPKNANGKIDRRELKERFQRLPAAVGS